MLVRLIDRQKSVNTGLVGCARRSAYIRQATSAFLDPLALLTTASVSPFRVCSAFLTERIKVVNKRYCDSISAFVAVFLSALCFEPDNHGMARAHPCRYPQDQGDPR